MDLMDFTGLDFDEGYYSDLYQVDVQIKEIEAARNLMWMSRGHGISYNSPIFTNDKINIQQQQYQLENIIDENDNKAQLHEIKLNPYEIYNTSALSPKNDNPLRSYVDQTNLNKYYTFKINENIERLPLSVTKIFNQLLEQSNIERSIFIFNELCENPLQCNYNPNKSTSICRDNNGRIEKRAKNNAASRVSRYKRKRQYQLSVITCEYLEYCNDSLAIELNEMATVIRQKEAELAQKIKSVEYIVQLREKCGLEACLF